MGKVGKTKKRIILLVLLLLGLGGGIAYGFRAEIAQLYAAVFENPPMIGSSETPNMDDNDDDVRDKFRLRNWTGTSPAQSLIPSKDDLKDKPDMMISGAYSFIPALSSNSKVYSYKKHNGTTMSFKELSIDPAVNDNVSGPIKVSDQSEAWYVTKSEVDNDQPYLLFTDVGYYGGETIDIKVIPRDVKTGVAIGYKKLDTASVASGVDRDRFLSISSTAKNAPPSGDFANNDFGFYPATIDYEFYVHKDEEHPTGTSANFTEAKQVDMLMTFVDFDYNEAVGVVAPDKYIDRIYTQIDQTDIDKKESYKRSLTNNLFYHYEKVVGNSANDTFWVIRNQRFNNTLTKPTNKWFSYTIKSTSPNEANPWGSTNKAVIRIKAAAGYVYYRDSNSSGLTILPDDKKSGNLSSRSSEWGSAIGFTQQSVIPVAYPLPEKSVMNKNVKNTADGTKSVEFESAARKTSDATVTFRIAQVSPARTLDYDPSGGATGGSNEMNNGEPELIFEDVLDPAFELDTEGTGANKRPAIWIVDRENPTVNLLTSAPVGLPAAITGNERILFDDYSTNGGTTYTDSEGQTVVRIRAKGDSYVKDNSSEKHLLRDPRYKDFYYNKTFFIYIRVKLKDEIEFSKKANFLEHYYDPATIVDPDVDNDAKIKPIDKDKHIKTRGIATKFTTKNVGSTIASIPNQARTIVTNPASKEAQTPRILYSNVVKADFSWKAKLIIKKLDEENDDPLPGAEFKVEQILPDGSKKLIEANVTTGTDGKYTVGTDKIVGGGTYLITETKPPKDYDISGTGEIEKTIDLYVEASKLDDPKYEPQLTVTFKDRKSKRKKALYLRACILDEQADIVKPVSGSYFTLYNENATNLRDSTKTATAFVPTQNNKTSGLTNTDFSKNLVILADKYDYYVVDPVIPEFYTYEGFAISDDASSNHSQHQALGGSITEARVDFSTKEEQYVTIYFKPNLNIGTVPFYNWDYQLNKFKKIEIS